MRTIVACLLASVVAGTLIPASAGEAIIFSNREGRKVVFDYSRSVRLLPPEMEDGRFNQSGSAGDSLMPFGDPSMSPSAVRRRKTLPKQSGDRDWIFADPAKAGREPQAIEPEDEEQQNESAMVKFMKGDSSRTADDREDLAGGGNGSEQDPSRRSRKRRGLDFRKLTGVTVTTLDPLQKLESEAGFSPAIEGQPELSRFLKADFRRQEDARHRRSMADFRARLSGPSQPSVGGVFGAGPSPQGLNGAPLQRPLNIGGPSQPLVAPQAGQPLSRRGMPNAFESRSMPLNSQGENAFRQKPRRIKREPLDMTIRKRDF